MEGPAFALATKRDYEGNPVRSEPTSDLSSTHCIPGEIRNSQRATSPAPSTGSSTLSDLSSMPTSQLPANPSGSPSKKRKLTFAEKEVEKAVKKAEREEKTRIKEEMKAQREEEKRIKDEERRRKAEEKEASRRAKDIEKAEKDAEKVQKDAEKAEKRRAKEAEKAEKDAEKAKKEADKLKKERSQMRLGAFFGRPAPVSTPPSTPDSTSSGRSSRRSSIASIDMPAPAFGTKTNSDQSEFSKWILPFFPHDHTIIAPHNRFLASGSSTPICVDLPAQYPNATSQPMNQRFSRPRRQRRNIVPVKKLISLIGGSESAPIDLTGRSTIDEPSLLLSRTPYKYISFSEDIRPPYQGTFTRAVSPRATSKLSRNPTCRALPEINYDYDSEAEWQAPEEGDEDLEDDDEMSEDEVDAEEMADFLDDENDILKRKLMTADVEPTSTGLCWEGETDLDKLGVDMEAYRMDVLHDQTKLPIDPYSNQHWSLIGKTTPLKPKPVTVDSTAMQPPRLPLATLTVPNGSPMRAFVINAKAEEGRDQKENASPQPQRLKIKNMNKPVKMISDDLLPAFKAAVSGSDLNKVALVEILKKQFPSCPKDAIKSTLETIAVRQGKKEVEKRWVLVG